MIHMRKEIRMLDLGLHPINVVGGMRCVNSTDRLQGRPADPTLTRGKMSWQRLGMPAFLNRVPLDGVGVVGEESE